MVWVNGWRRIEWQFFFDCGKLGRFSSLLVSMSSVGLEWPQLCVSWPKMHDFEDLSGGSKGKPVSHTAVVNIMARFQDPMSTLCLSHLPIDPQDANL